MKSKDWQSQGRRSLAYTTGRTHGYGRNLYKGGCTRSTSLNKGFFIGSAVDFEEKFGIIHLLLFFSLQPASVADQVDWKAETQQAHTKQANIHLQEERQNKVRQARKTVMQAKASEPSLHHSAAGKPGDALLSALATTSTVFIFTLLCPKHHVYKLNTTRVCCSGSWLLESCSTEQAGLFKLQFFYTKFAN